MKSFSPAGAAVKGFFGYKARTFGNPDGAATGGGAWTGVVTPFGNGGANDMGPNQGGGGGGSNPFVGQFTMHAAAGSANGDIGASDGVIDPTQGPAFGSFSGSTLTKTVGLMYWHGGSVGVRGIGFGVSGGPYLQNAFTKIQFTGNNGAESLTTASASVFQSSASGTYWLWQHIDPAASFTAGNSYVCTTS